MRAFDKQAIETFHVPGIVLMENAGRGAADVISALLAREVLPSRSRPSSGAVRARMRSFPVRHVPVPGQPATYPLEARVVVVCGAGSNGGDGFVVARHLLSRGAQVEVFLAANAEQVTGESRINLDSYVDLGGALSEIPSGADLSPLKSALDLADLSVDAVFGTGLDRPIVGHLADVVRALASASCRMVALDVPSGLHADSGSALGAVVQADDTVTFGHLKIGLLTPEGARLAGRVHVVDLGIPDRAILDRVGHLAEVIRPELVGALLAPREANLHKYRAGNVLVVAGSSGKVGASVLCARGALRAGAGLATICTWPDAAASLDARAVEQMTLRLDEARLEASVDEALEGRGAVAIGPGLGLGDAARRVIERVLLRWEGTKVVDADALTCFQGRPEVLRSAPGKLVLTPHAGELGRLLGRSAQAIEADRFGAVTEAARITGAIVVLKGARTVVATPEGHMHVCMAGNPALATAGAGDVLAGVIAALSCALGDALTASCAGVLVHALAADRWRARVGTDRGLLASEVADEVPEVIARLQRSEDPLA
jgi:hydroxyethylthiazole kinase-like uncharacterized protein yjeF